MQGPASGQLANASHMLSLLMDQNLLPSSEPSHPPGTSAHSDEYEDSDGSEQSDLEPAPAEVFRSLTQSTASGSGGAATSGLASSSSGAHPSRRTSGGPKPVASGQATAGFRPQDSSTQPPASGQPSSQHTLASKRNSKLVPKSQTKPSGNTMPTQPLRVADVDGLDGRLKGA